MRQLITRVLSGWADLHPLLRLGVLVLVLAGAAVTVLPPGYRLFRSWRLERNLEAAQVAVDQNRMIEVCDLLLAVLRSGDPRIDAFRILEKSAHSLRDPRHGEIARALMSHPQSTDDDRLRGFLGTVSRLPLGLLGQAWAELPENCQQDPRFAAAFGARLIDEQRLGEASGVLLGVPEARRTAEIDRGLIRVLIASGRREGFDEAQKRIVECWARDETSLTDWLDLLEEIPPVSLKSALLAPLRPRLADAGGPHPARRAMMAARIDYGDQFAQRAGVVERTIARWHDAEPAELARFLSALGLHGQLLELVTDEQAVTDPDLFGLVLETARKALDWERAGRLLDTHGELLPAPERAAYQTARAAATGNAPARTEAWSNAMREAGEADHDRAFLDLHRLAQRLELPTEAEQALVAAIRSGRGPLPLYADIKPLVVSLSAAGQEQALLEIGAVYLPLEPANPVLLTQYAYLACINELVEPAAILDALKPLAQLLPDEIPVQFTIALAHLCDGRADEATAVINSLKADQTRLPRSFQAIALATRVMNGELAKDDPALREFPSHELLPSERRRFHTWIRK